MFKNTILDFINQEISAERERSIAIVSYSFKIGQNMTLLLSPVKKYEYNQGLSLTLEILGCYHVTVTVSDICATDFHRGSLCLISATDKTGPTDTV